MKKLETVLTQFHKAVEHLENVLRQKLIGCDNFWMEMADMCNKASRIHNEKMAEDIFSFLPKTSDYFRKCLKEIKILRGI